MCNLNAHSAGMDCTYECRRERYNGHRRGARRRQGCPEHKGRKLCSLIRRFVTLIVCLYARYDVIVICNPSPIISAFGYRGD